MPVEQLILREMGKGPPVEPSSVVDGGDEYPRLLEWRHRHTDVHLHRATRRPTGQPHPQPRRLTACTYTTGVW